VRRFPEQRFVIDHLAKPAVRTGQLEPWADQMRQIADHANTWCKLSGLVTEAEWGKWNSEQAQPCLEVALQVFGPDRLMFGSDWPVCLLSASYTQVMQLVRDAIAHLPTEQQQNILELNAISFYGIRDFDHGSPTSK
jgi:L-fuconolactonase